MLREPLTPDGQPKLEISVQTFNLENARAVWPGASELDVGHIHLHFDPKNAAETAAAQAAYEAAKGMGSRFFLLRSEEGLDGEMIPDEATWDQVVQMAEGASWGDVSSTATPAEDAPRRSGRRRIQSVARLAGGAV